MSKWHQPEWGVTTPLPALKLEAPPMVSVPLVLTEEAGCVKSNLGRGHRARDDLRGTLVGCVRLDDVGRPSVAPVTDKASGCSWDDKNSWKRP